MTVDVSRILAALGRERELATAGSPFVVTDAWHAGGQPILRIEAKPGGKTTPVDESLGGARLVWGGTEPVRADVLYVDAEESRLVLDGLTGDLPRPGDVVVAYPPDFLTPLIDLWNREDLARQALLALEPKLIPRAMALQQAVHTSDRHLPRASEVRSETLQRRRPTLPLAFAGLRRRQADAVQLVHDRMALLIGPPGTGKTFTVGAMVAHLLASDPHLRILITGPTNVAVDAALLAADDWLERLGRRELRTTMKRVGSRFDVRKYTPRQHLLATGVADAAGELATLELAEPRRADVEAYTAWTRAMDRTRRRLWRDVHEIAVASRVVAVTTVSAYLWYDPLTLDVPRFDVVIADEASQIIQPGAAMLSTLGERIVFAGDPGQLAPVVHTKDARFQRLLSRTAFDVVGVPRVMLDEQSRMVPELCAAVSHAFYGGRLEVCRRALADDSWQKRRRPSVLGGVSLARLHIDEIATRSQWSPRYNGRIRFDSAHALLTAAEALHTEAGHDIAEILVLTPFRAQRALLQAMARQRGLGKMRISTVHRSQGSESRIVLFDPVDANTPFLTDANGRRLINVAISRGQAHVIVFASNSDLANPWLARVATHATSRGMRFTPAAPAPTDLGACGKGILSVGVSPKHRD
jgi:hypothetical protein